MTIMDWVFNLVTAVLWYWFLYYFLYSIKNKVNLYQAAFILLILCYAAFIACPFIRYSAAWKALLG